MPRKPHKGRITVYRQKPKLSTQYSNPNPTPKTRQLATKEEQSGTKFQVLPPLAQAHRFTEKELIDKAIPSEIAWLYEHPILWYRALQQLRAEVQNHLAKARLDLQMQRSAHVIGKPPPEYMEHLRRAAEQQLKQRHFLRLVERRMENIVSLLGTDKPVTQADYVHSLLSLAKMIDDDELIGARDLALNMADRIQAQQSKKK